MRELTPGDLAVACGLAVLAAVAGGGNPVAGLVLLTFMAGLYLSVRLSRGRRFGVRLTSAALAFAVPLVLALAISRS